jgi:hypothetical protein
MGGGFQPGYPWLFVTDSEAEGITVSAICALSFDFVARRYPTLIMPTRHSWNLSMKSYWRIMPKVARKLEGASRTGRLLVANIFTTPKYRPDSDSELYIDPAFYPTQLQWEITSKLDRLETGGETIFWRLTSFSDLTRTWPDDKIMDAFGPLLVWFHGRGAIGVATLNRELTSESLKKWAVSFFPNVAYVETEPRGKAPHRIRVVKSINPRVSYAKKKFKLTAKYQTVID